MIADPRARALGWWGALAAGSAVALGAFGTHALAEHLSAARLLTFETAVRYQFLHALALLLLQLTARQGALHAAHAQRIGAFFGAGIVLFSGSLYALVATDFSPLGAVAPIGGGAFIGGWLWWAWALRPQRQRA